jgi:hypothetical protein
MNIDMKLYETVMAVATYENIQCHNLENHDLNYVKLVKNTSVQYSENMSQQIHI